MKSGRLPLCAGSRFGTLIGTGVPTNSGLGRSVFSGTLSSRQRGGGGEQGDDNGQFQK